MKDAALFESIAEDSPDAIVLVDEKGLIRFWNRTAESMFGHPREQAMGLRLAELILQGDEPPPSSHGPPEKRSASFDAVARSATGALLYVNVASRPIGMASEIGACEVYNLADVSQLRTRRDAQLLEARYSQLLDSMPDAVVVVNEIGRIALVNPQAEEMFGYRASELVGTPLETLLPERYRATHGRHRERYMGHPHARPMGQGLELHGQRNGGEEFPVEISLSPLRTDLGMFALSAIRDISERRRVERVLEEKNLELQRANQAKDRFLATMSHELRTPLNAIIGFTGILLMRLPGPLTAEQEKQLSTVQQSGKHLLSLINDLLDVAKIDAGGMQMHRVPIEARALVDEVASTLRPIAHAKGLELAVRASQPAAWVHADRRALQQILINLANNAIKFTERGVVELFVEPASDGLWAMGVCDTGSGISQADMARLFEAFSQVGSRQHRSSIEGTGLGLYLCRKLAELHDTAIQVDSQLGQGSRFWLSLPAVPAQDEAAA
ncbi:PAS domain S-box protein [Ideonella sp. DXS29W]|uniref:histidine kinase n=1 Tax=Ideonella lacteola TaxID=2984193 RepID=A0ABU9BW64_9BURK